MKKIKFSAIEKNDSFKVLRAIGTIEEQMPPHLSDRSAFLMIAKGAIQFNLDGNGSYLKKDDCISIPKDKVHSFEVVEPCEVLLTLDAEANIRFV